MPATVFFCEIRIAYPILLIMFRILIVIVLFVPISSSGRVHSQSSEIHHVASFNIHYIVPDDKNENWERRKHAVAKILKEMDADIVAFQEMETFDGGHYSKRNLQLDWIIFSTTGYKIAAIGDPKVFPHTQPIIYKADKYTVINQGFFFFSDTPDEIYSRQWNGGYPYFCSWVLLQIKNTDRTFYVYNVHNDYKSRSNRLKTSKLISERIEEIVDEDIPIIVLGDFNVQKWDKELDMLKAIGLNIVPPSGSTNRILGLPILPAIDHILVSEGIKPQSDIIIWRNRYDGVYPSDHFPISAELTF